jgi:homoserine O-acetyltransferase
MEHSTIMKKLNLLHGTLLALALFCATALVAQTAPQAGVQQFASLGDFKLTSGETLVDCQLGYRTLGTLNADKSNAILFPTWYGGTTEQLAGNAAPGGLADSSKYFVILVDALGNGVSSAPSNSKAQPRMKFPRISMRDMVNAEHEMLVKVLHIDHLRAVMGISMGGMQTFQWMVSYPEFMDKAIPIVGSPRQTAFDLEHWQADNEAIMADPAWKGGDYASMPPLALRAKLNGMMMTTPERFNETNTREQVLASFQKPAENTSDDPNNHIRQAEAMMSLDVSDVFGGDMSKAAAAVKAKVLVVSSKQDHMVVPAPALAFAKQIGAEVLLLDGNCGHLATSCESGKMVPVVQAFLSK